MPSVGEICISFKNSMLLCYGGGIPESPGSHELGSVRSLSHKVVWAQVQFTVTFKWEHTGSGTSSTKEHK